jgi:flagellar assembly protein FliH
VKLTDASGYRSAVAFDLGDIEAQAAAVMSVAEAGAAAVISAAEKEAVAIRARAEAGGRESGLAAGREEGLKAGADRGREEAFAQAREEITAAVEGLTAACAELARLKDGLFTLAESDLLKLSILIAKKIVAREINADAHVTAENVKRCLDLLSQRRNLVVRVAPSAIETVEARLPELSKRLGDLSSVKVVADAAVSPGGCLVTGESGVIDATIESQFAEAERILFGEPNA